VAAQAQQSQKTTQQGKGDGGFAAFLPLFRVVEGKRHRKDLLREKEPENKMK
jgi:hypothetical protein